MKRFISLFLSVLLIFPVIPFGITLNAKAESIAPTIFTVDPTATANGTTVFNKIQDAINAVPATASSSTPYEIKVKNGTYTENLILDKSGVTLTGESQDGVIVITRLPDLVYLNDGGYTKFRVGGTTYDTSSEYTPAVLTLKASDCTLQNITLKISDYYTDMGPISAIAIDSNAQRNIFKYCTLGGGQDTLYDNGRCYYYKCVISGSVDFMYGQGTSVFDSCDIKSIYWERLYNISEVKGIISYGLSDNDRASRGITDDDIALWTATDPQRSKYKNIVSGPNLRTPGTSTKQTDYATPDFTRVLTADELNALSDAELSIRQIARDSSSNPNGWKTIAELTASDSKRIKKVNSGHITACSTPQSSTYGYLIINCNLIGDSRLAPESVDLGRPWRPYAQTTYVNTRMGAHILAAGWNNWGSTANESTARYEEYGSVNLDGTPYDLSKRLSWAKILSDTDVLSRNPYNYLKGNDGWDPTNQKAYYDELDTVANNLPINSLQFVSSNIDLPSTDTSSGAKIQWLSSNTNLISTSGVVNRPAYNAQNESVTLTAAISKNGHGVLKAFNLTVLKAPDSSATDPDTIACNDAYSALQTGVIPGLNLSAIKTDLKLPAAGINGTTLEWKSFNPGITDTGKVTRPAGTASDSTGVLQLTIRKNQAAVAYKLDTKVIKNLLPTAGMYKAKDFVGVGVGGATGSVSYDEDSVQFAVYGSGSGFTKTMIDNDVFYFAGVLMTGDFSISAKISGLSGGSSPTPGLTIRDSLDPLSKHITQGMVPGKGPRRMYRNSQKANGSGVSYTISDTYYMQLTKAGTDIYQYVSTEPLPAVLPASSTATINVNKAGGTGIGIDANGNEKEIYTGFVVNGGAGVNFSEVRIVTADGIVVFDSSAKVAPNAPVNVVAAAGDKSATLTWDTVTNATYYVVKQSTSEQGPFTVTDSVYSIVYNQVQAQITNLVNGTQYFYVVTAGNKNGESSPSQVVSVTPVSPDTLPPVITMNKVPNSRVLNSMLALSGSIDKACTLTIKNNGNLIKLTGNDTSLALGPNGSFNCVINLTEGVTNNIVIRAVDANGNSAEKDFEVTYGMIKPSDFIGADIGTPNAAGSVSFDEDTNTFTMIGAGSGISKNAAGPDQTFFSGVKLTGDYTINAKITVPEYANKSLNGYAGLSFRAGLNTDSYQYTQMMQIGKYYQSPRRMWRYSGSASGSSAKISPFNGIAYVRVIKTGDSIKSFISSEPLPENPTDSDFTSTNACEAKELGLDANGNPKELYVGMILSSGNTNIPVTAYVEDVTILNSDGAVIFDSNVGVPVPPKNVKALGGDKCAYINWNSLSTATSYTVKQSESANGPFTTVQTVAGSVYKAQINNLENDKIYYFVVTASNDSGEGPVSKVVKATPSADAAIPPTITISNEPGSEVFSAVLPLKGSVSKASTITISLNGSLIKLNGENTDLEVSKGGTFSTSMILKQGVNEIIIKALDEYGLETTKTYTVTYTYKTANINFYDSDGNVVSGLIPGKDIIVKAHTENYIVEKKATVLVVAIYDAENNLVKFIFTSEAISNGESEIFDAKFKLPDDVSGYTVKAFVWDNFVNMHPVSEVVILK